MTEKSKKAWRFLRWAILLIVFIFLTVLVVIANSGNIEKKAEPSTRRTILKPKAATLKNSLIKDTETRVEKDNEPFSLIPVIPDKPKVSEAAVLEELQVNFNSDVTSVKVNDNGKGDVRIDVYTSFLPDKQVSQYAQGLAFIAADGLYAVNKLCPNECTVNSFVWPKNREFFLTHATATFDNGTLVSENIIINDVLK